MPPSRRGVLGSIGTSGAAALGIGSISGLATAADEKGIDRSEVTGSKRGSIVSRISKSKAAQTLFRAVKKDTGFVPRRQDARVTRTTTDDVDEFVAVVPFVNPGSSEEVETYLLWTTSDELETKVYDYNVEDQTTVYSLDGSGSESRDVSKEVHEWENPGQSKTATASTESTFSTQDCACECSTYTCDSYNWNCVLDFLASIAIAGGSCFSCVVDPTKATCAICLGSAIKVANPMCNLGNNCRTETRCVDSSKCSRNSNCSYT